LGSRRSHHRDPSKRRGRQLIQARGLSAQLLAESFGAKSEPARVAVPAFHDAAVRGPLPALAAWREQLGHACGLGLDQPSKHLVEVGRHYGLAGGALQPAALLFALHSYYAAVVHGLVAQFPEIRGIRLLEEADPLGWYARDPHPAIADVVARLATVMNDLAPAAVEAVAPGGDLLKPLYESLFPRRLRHALGEYYTPDWLAEHVLDQVGYTGDPDQRLLDPSCGSGAFLLAALRRIRANLAHHSAIGGKTEGFGIGRKILANVVGLDLSPLAVLAARANYLIAVRDLLPRLALNGKGESLLPVHRCDSILNGPGMLEPFDYVVGNPPWIAWDHLPAGYRQATKPLWQQYGLFSLSGRDARHGGGKKDLSMLMLYASADRYLRAGGRLGMVVTQTVFQTRGAGDGFRRFRLGPNGAALGVLRVDDMVALKPFRGAANWTSVVVLEKDRPPHYPVPYFVWKASDRGESDDGRRAQLPDSATAEQCWAQPIDAASAGSPWFVWPQGLACDPQQLVGPSDYTAHLGANSGGANAVYWLKVLGGTRDGVRVSNAVQPGRDHAEPLDTVIEPDLLYPLVRWSDVARYAARPSAHLLLAQDPETRTGIDEPRMRARYPRTYAYLERFRDVLAARAAYRRYQDTKPFYSMYNVGPYTVASVKVVWRRMDRQIRAAVVEPVEDPLLGLRPAVPQETCVLVACDCGDEAHYLCAVLNSEIVHFLASGHSVRGGKGFGTPGILESLRIRRFDPRDPRHCQLADCSREAHAAVTACGEPGPIQALIDRLAAALW